MNKLMLISVLFIQNSLSTVLIEPTILEGDHYCVVKEPVHSYTFNFLKLSNPSKDSIIKLDSNKTEYLRVHFCHSLLKTCNGKEGYSVCFHTHDGQEIGVGKNPPEVDLAFGKIIFKYTGDKCNNSRNYTVNFEMTCNFFMEDEVAVDFDLIHDRKQCDIYMVLETRAACAKRKQFDCTVQYNSSHYDLKPLTNLTSNYEVFINENLTVLLNICHSLQFGDSYFNNNSDSAVCLVNSTDKTNVSFTNLGNIEEDSHVYIQGEHLVIDYNNGSLCKQYLNTSLRMRTTITFICDLTAIDSLPEYIGGLEECHYKFSWKTTAACSEEVLYSQSLKGSEFCAIKDPLTNFEYDLKGLKNQVHKIEQSNGNYEFSVCGLLSGSICKSKSGICRTLNGVSYGISGGIGNANLMWKEDGPYLNYTDGDECAKGKRRYTIIAFSCGPTNASYVEEELCHTVINWTTDIICKKPCTDTDHDVSFQSLIRSSNNYVINNNHTKFHINICRSLVPEQFLRCSYNTGICKKITDHSGKLMSEISLGEWNDNLKVFSNGTAILTYQNGSICNENSNYRLSSKILFVCDLNIEEGFPKFRKYNDCIYYFEWRTKLSCGKVNSTLNKNCELTNTRGEFLNFSKIKQYPLQNVKKKNEEGTYYMSICGTQKICNDSFVCDGKMSYGRKLSILSDYTKNIIDFQFTNGSQCYDGSLARSTLHVICNETTNVGKPVLLQKQFCNLEFEWITNAICKLKNKSIIETKTLHLHGSKSYMFPVGTTISILFLFFIILITYFYLRNTSRRSQFLSSIGHFIVSLNPCKKNSNSTESLCL